MWSVVGGGDVSRLVDVAAPVPKLPPSAVRPPAVRTSERLTSQSRVVTCHGPGYPGSPSSNAGDRVLHPTLWRKGDSRRVVVGRRWW